MVQELPIAEDQRIGEFGQFYPRISRYVLTLLRDASDAEDATQETFLRAHVGQESLREPGAALSWLYSIATHVCLDLLRARSRQTQRESRMAPEACTRADASASAELRVEQSEMSACVRSFVGELSDSYRAVLLLHDAHGMTSREIAAVLGDSPGAVKIRLHRARNALRSSLRAGCAFTHDERGALVCDPDPHALAGDVSLGPARSSY